jgi:H+/Cl- antiporter ClcA
MISSQYSPPLMQQRQIKPWIRPAILTAFGVIFGLSLFHRFAPGMATVPSLLIAALSRFNPGAWLSRRLPGRPPRRSRWFSLTQPILRPMTTNPHRRSP